MNQPFLASLTLLLVSVLTASQAAADDPPPESLLAFLKPKMIIRIQPIQGSADVFITVYSPNEFLIAQDSANLELDELAEKHESVRTQIALLTKPDHTVRLIRYGTPLFAEVEDIGSDYVLVKVPGNGGQMLSAGSGVSFTHSQRRVLAKRSIARIDLDGAGVRLEVSPTRVGDKSQ